MVGVWAGGGEEVPLAWGGLGGCLVRVGCCCRAWGWARTRWGFELGGVARRAGVAFPPRPGTPRSGHLKKGGSPRSEGPACVGCLGCTRSGAFSLGSGGVVFDRCRCCEAFSALGSCGSHGGEASGLFGGFGSRVEIGLHVLGPLRPVEPGREVVEVIRPVFGIHVGVGAPVRTPTPATAAAPIGLAVLGFVVVVVGDDRLAGRGLLDRPARSVDAAVVETAQQDQVLSVRVAAVGPVDDVVGFGPSDREVAAVPGAPLGLLEFELATQSDVGEAQARPSSTASPVL